MCWKKFQFIFEGDSQIRSGASFIVRCKICQAFKMYQRRNGTTNLLIHVCKKGKNDSAEFAKVTSADKVKFTEAAAQFCASDMRPFKTIQGKGLANLLQTAIDIQCNHVGRLNIQDLVPDPTTLSRNVQTQGNNIKGTLIKLIKSIRDDINLTFTLDIWKDISSEVS